MLEHGSLLVNTGCAQSSFIREENQYRFWLSIYVISVTY
nr:MAG TPA_asm: hypothetical protein [Caudoviricetes sp.]DAL99958.1 MAG TPA: hypothetical protein [Caudoviricetes sp.]DAM11638.1 MAG TPA: hypothetical protein [Caudoviricetes sp.]